MRNIEKLLSISSESLAPKPCDIPEVFRHYALGADLFKMLELKNGFYAFEFALHMLPLTSDPGTGLEGWNDGKLWKNEYADLTDGLMFFAEDIVQDQFCLSLKRDGVFRFHSETGLITLISKSIEEWAGQILSNYPYETGWSFGHEWQRTNGPLPLGKRLMPKTPFFLGGEYNPTNLWAGNSLEGMRFKADLAMQTRDLPEGSKIRLNISPRPE